MIAHILEASTCHVTQGDMEQFRVEEGFSVGDFKYGVFIHVPLDDCELKSYSPSVAKLFAVARVRSCRFIVLDRDAGPEESKDLDRHKW